MPIGHMQGMVDPGKETKKAQLQSTVGIEATRAGCDSSIVRLMWELAHRCIADTSWALVGKESPCPLCGAS